MTLQLDAFGHKAVHCWGLHLRCWGGSVPTNVPPCVDVQSVIVPALVRTAASYNHVALQVHYSKSYTQSRCVCTLVRTGVRMDLTAKVIDNEQEKVRRLFASCAADASSRKRRSVEQKRH